MYVQSIIVTDFSRINNNNHLPLLFVCTKRIAILTKAQHGCHGHHNALAVHSFIVAISALTTTKGGCFPFFVIENVTIADFTMYASRSFDCLQPFSFYTFSLLKDKLPRAAMSSRHLLAFNDDCLVALDLFSSALCIQ